MKDRITPYIRAAYSGLFVLSHEELRVSAVLKDVTNTLQERFDESARKARAAKKPVDDLNATLWTWSLTRGVHCEHAKDESQVGQVVPGLEDPVKAVTWVQRSAPEGAIVLMKDFHLLLEQRNPMVWRAVKDALLVCKARNVTLVVVGCRLALPPELEKEFVVLDFSLPGKDQLRSIASSLATASNINAETIDLEAVTRAAAGLTTIEAENAFALSIIETGNISAEIVYREKCATIRKNGLLEVVDQHIELDKIGGLAHLKAWLEQRKDAFSDAARQYGLPMPRGTILVGQPGCGKTLTAIVCKTVFGVPLLRLDASRLFGSLVGQTEQNWRTVITIARSMAPCIVHIDEVDGMMAGSESSGKSDGGTTARTIKSIIQDMENSPGVFFVMTANDIDAIPSPVLRRLDEVWNVELPTSAERAQIWAIQIKKFGRKPEDFNLGKLAEESDGFSGFEIEKCVTQAMYRAYYDGRREPTTEDALAVTKDFIPLSKTAASDIQRRRERLKGVAKLAGAGEEKTSTKVNRRLGGFSG